MRGIDEFVSGDGKIPQPRTLLDVVSSNAISCPDKTWTSVPMSRTVAAMGYQDLTYGQLHNAVNRSARWLRDVLELEKTSAFETLAYLGPPDTRYIVFTLAAIKAGYQMLYLSPRNSDEAQWSVIREAKCTKFLCAKTMQSKVEQLINNPYQGVVDQNAIPSTYSRILSILAPEEAEILDKSLVPDYPYEKTAKEARRDPLVVLHTSSTTGLPKTISLNQGYGFHEDIIQHLPMIDGYDLITRKPFYGHCRMFVAMPLFHAGGVLLSLLKALYHDVVIVFQPADVPLNAHTVNDILQHGHCNGCVLPPSLIEDMLPVPEYMDTLANLDFVQFGSGPLSKGAGEALIARQKNCPHFIGSSEVGLLPVLELDDPAENWQFFNFHPWAGVDFRPVDEEGSHFRLFIIRTKSMMGLQPVFELFPSLEEWDTRELYVRHPTRAGLWRCCGRIDDVLVLSNGEKLNPIETEAAISNCVPDIKNALVVGAGRFMPGLILETTLLNVSNQEERRRLLDELRPTLERVNKQAPKHGQLTESLIFLTNSGKPFERTPKLSIKRQKTIEAFDQEINDMYDQYEATLDSADDAMLPSTIDWQTQNSIEDFFSKVIMNCTGWRQMPRADEDLFSHGMDSFHVVRIVRATRAALIYQHILNEQRFDTRSAYEHSSVTKLSRFLQTLLSEPSQTHTNGHSNGHTASSEAALDELVAKLSSFPWTCGSSPSTKKLHASKATVILTGSTGSFGTFLLSVLMASCHVSHVYCCDRAKDARSRHMHSVGTQGLSLDLSALDKRVTFLQTSDLSAPQLGLGSDIYSTLQAKVTHVLHNAWPVNFNLSLNSFVPHVEGVRRLIDFCAATSHASNFVFVSSVSSVSRFGAGMHKPGLIPARIVHDSSVPSPIGYGQSKNAAERIVSAATKTSAALPARMTVPLRTVVLRVGQIAGPVCAAEGKGIWTMREWFPRLVATSKVINALPQTLGKMDDIDWIPIDMLAGIVCELVGLAPTSTGERTDWKDSDVHNLVNPTTISWKAKLLPVAKDRLGISRTITLNEWVQRVRDWPTEQEVPAAKILDFYQGLVGDDQETLVGAKFETAKTLSCSGTMREMGPVREEWLMTWLRQWEYGSQATVP